MTVAEFNAMIESAYEAGFAFEDKLALAYTLAFNRASNEASLKFKREVVTAAANFVPPPDGSLTQGMTEDEQARVDRIRDRAAEAIAASLAAIGLTAVAVSFMEAISKRGALNFEQELEKTIRNVVSKGLAEGWTADETALQLEQSFQGVSSPTARMLAQTELTSLVNERSLLAAQKQFADRSAPLYKVWQTMKDARVRAPHAAAQSQSVPINSPFSVGGYQMMYPGDPSAPLQLTARCRCRMTYSDSLSASGKEDTIVDVNPGSYTVADPAGNDVTSAFKFNFHSSGTPLSWDLNTTLAPGDYFFKPYPYVTGTPFTTITVTTDNTVEDSPEPVSADAPMEDGPAWKALLAVEDQPTGDGRMLAADSITWREPPLSLMALDFTGPGAHEGARVAGRIDSIYRDGLEVWAEGVFNSDEFGMHIAELVSNGSLKGNSIDPGGATVELWNAETMEPFASDEDAMAAMMNGTEILQVFTSYVIAASTVCPTPAIGDAQIMLASGVLQTSFFTPFKAEAEALTAAGAGLAPLHPPLDWYKNPNFDGPTAMIVTPEGRVMGHAALWNSCHIGEPSGPGVCVPPPRSGMQYEIFHHGVVETAEGVEVPCGQITMSTLHAGRDLSWKQTLEHYEHSGCAVADVIAGEDLFGIWVSGGLRPDLPAERVRELKGGSLSGDWREVIGRGLEFLAALVVNIPGFPIPRPEARIVASASGEEQVLALVAAGMVTPEDVEGMSRRDYLRKVGVLTRD